MSSVPRLTIAAAAIGGISWIIKTVTITVRDAYFEPLESVFFFVGMVGVTVAIATLAWHLTARLNTAMRTFASFAAVVAIVIFSLLIDKLVSAVYTGDNLGIDSEVGFFVLGVLAVGFAAFNLRGSRRSVSAA